MRCKGGIFKNQAPILAMLLTQLIYTGMFLLSKAAISSGMKPYVFVAYRQAVAALVLAPFAYFYERKNSSSLTWRLVMKIYMASIFGLHLSMNLTYFAFRYVSATYSTAISNIVPAFVLLMAVPLRMEKLCLSERQGQAKILCLILCISGAMVFSFYKGPPIIYRAPHNHPIARRYTTRSETIKGCVMAVAAQIAWAIWLLAQKPIVRDYKSNLRLTAMQCGFGSVTTAIYGLAVDRRASSWMLLRDGSNDVLSVLYCGIAVTGVTYALQIWVVEKRGPVYPVIFNPLSLVLTAIFSAVLFHETLHWG
ncbi:hypothetical protein M569_03050, partial [Genlisea aurea]